MDGDQVELTPAEYPLLGILANRAGNLVTNHRLVEDFGDHPPIIVTSNVSAS
jgi:DNA-binding response OmpR family regulator